MKVTLGSKNPVKLAAVEKVLRGYELFSNATIIGVSVESGVGEQPLSLEQTIKGAKARSKQAFLNCNYSIGLECGLMEIPATDGEYCNLCICSIYDGERYHIGQSCGFRLPKQVSDRMIHEGLDLNQAMLLCDLTENVSLGKSQGSIGVFTNGRICRTEYTVQAIITALISVENSGMFFLKEVLLEVK